MLDMAFIFMLVCGWLLALPAAQPWGRRCIRKDLRVLSEIPDVDAPLARQAPTVDYILGKQIGAGASAAPGGATATHAGKPREAYPTIKRLLRYEP